MFKAIAEQINRDQDYPERQHTIDVLTRVLEGTIFDHLEHGFHEETRGTDNQYIPLRQRRPSVKYNLPKIIVDDTVGLLFSEGHFPKVDCDNQATVEALAQIIKDARLNERMIEAATMGAVGSVAVLLRVLKGRVFVEVMNTQFLTPVFDPEAPDTLKTVRQQYKVKGRDFAAIGVSVEDEDADYWFICDWTEAQEVYYLPHPVEEDDKPLRIDARRTKDHKLGFVPIVWVKNLPGRLNVAGMQGADFDGYCTFSEAIDTMVEIVYQLSQGGRGLKYSSDPTLVLRNPVNESGEVIKGANAIVLRDDGDAKMLEISGQASNAVIEYCRALREFALEAVHGNRATADRIGDAPSGRAMELMNHALIILADKLRASYGEGALLDLLNMVKRISNKIPLVTKDGDKIPAIPMSDKIRLVWPDWYPPSTQDKLDTANTLRTLKDGGLMSTETAVKSNASTYDIEDVPTELAQIDKEQQAQAERDAATARKATITE